MLWPSSFAPIPLSRYREPPLDGVRAHAALSRDCPARRFGVGKFEDGWPKTGSHPPGDAALPLGPLELDAWVNLGGEPGLARALLS